jgi:catechol 2,3-dioxygenase-like lactoylglutathione lyase family enzyme
MFTHVTVGTKDLETARTFYDKVLGAIGYTRTADLGDNASIWGENGSTEFFVLKPANGEPASVGNGGTISFAAKNRAGVQAFHDAALSLGGPDEGAVGTRGWAPNAYAGYTRDPDGNKLAVYSFSAD